MTLVLLMVQLGLVLVVAMLLGHLGERLRLPAIAGQLLAGVVLGPSVFGAVMPGLYGVLFAPHNVLATTVRTDFLQIGLLLFIFLVGLEIDVGALQGQLRTIIPTATLSMIVPFVAGFAAVVIAPALWQGPREKPPLALPLIIAVALSISALPVIAAIVKDLALLRTKVGQIILSAAVINDLCGWLGFAAVAAAFTATGKSALPLPVVMLIVLVGFAAALTGGRALGRRSAPWVTQRARRGLLALGLVLAIVLLVAAVLEGSGAHAFFGALIVGLALSDRAEHYLEPLERMVRCFFAPLYFGAVGLSVDVISNFDVSLVIVVFLIACLGKLSGGAVGARIGGCSWRDSLAIASGMNARGAIEILLAILALSVGLITTRIFVAIVVMALATSILAGFFLQLILHIKHPAKLVRSPGPVLQRLDEHGRPSEDLPLEPHIALAHHGAKRVTFPLDPATSADHALIRPARGRYRVDDRGQTKRALVWRNARWQEADLTDLEDGDMLLIGDQAFRFAHGH